MTPTSTSGFTEWTWSCSPLKLMDNMRSCTVADTLQHSERSILSQQKQMCWNNMSILGNNPTKWLTCYSSQARKLQAVTVGGWASALKECQIFPTTHRICVSILISHTLSDMYCAVIQLCLLLHTWLWAVLRTRHPFNEWKHDAVFEAELLLRSLSFEIVSSYCSADDLHSLFFL